MILLRKYLGRKMILTTRTKKSRFFWAIDLFDEAKFFDVHLKSSEDAHWLQKNLGFKYCYAIDPKISESERPLGWPWENLNHILRVIAVGRKELTERLLKLGYSEISQEPGGNFLCLS